MRGAMSDQRLNIIYEIGLPNIRGGLLIPVTNTPLLVTVTISDFIWRKFIFILHKA